MKPSDFDGTLKSPAQAPAEGEPKEEDVTPWASLASFAIYKLFNEWKDGHIGGDITDRVPQKYPMSKFS